VGGAHASGECVLNIDFSFSASLLKQQRPDQSLIGALSFNLLRRGV